MSAPFRDRHLRCPACPEAMLREHLERLVCDACTGIMMSVEDLIGGITELVNTQPELEFLPRPTERRTCPRCPQQMSSCRLRITFPILEKAKKVRVTLDRCDAHGLWFDGEELAKILEACNRLASAGPRGGGGGGGGGTTMMPGAGRGWGFGA